MSNDPLRLHLEALYLQEIGWKSLGVSGPETAERRTNMNEVFPNHVFSVGSDRHPDQSLAATIEPIVAGNVISSRF